MGSRQPSPGVLEKLMVAQFLKQPPPPPSPYVSEPFMWKADTFYWLLRDGVSQALPSSADFLVTPELSWGQ